MRRTSTGQLIYASSERCADLLYLTGFLAEDPFFWYRAGDTECIIVSELELGRAQKQAKKHLRILSYNQALQQLRLTRKQFLPENVIAAISRHHGIYSWTVPQDFPYSLVCGAQSSRLRIQDKVGSVGERLSFNCSNGPFCPGRAVKSPEEIELIRQAEQIAEKGLAKGIAMLAEASIGKNGVLQLNGKTLTSEILHSEVNAELVRNGGFSSSTIIAPGKQAADPHQAGHGPIHANQPIVFDIFPRALSGYFGDLSRTVIKGKAPDIVKKAFDAVYAAQRTVIENLKPGMTGQEAHFMAANLMEERGFKTDLTAPLPCGFFHGLGHSLGLEIHESPSLNTRNSKPLAAGNVVTVEPGLYYPEWGGIRIEDVVAITENGAEDLTTVDVFLEIE